MFIQKIFQKNLEYLYCNRIFFKFIHLGYQDICYIYFIYFIYIKIFSKKILSFFCKVIFKKFFTIFLQCYPNFISFIFIFRINQLNILNLFF